MFAVWLAKFDAVTANVPPKVMLPDPVTVPDNDSPLTVPVPETEVTVPVLDVYPLGLLEGYPPRFESAPPAVVDPVPPLAIPSVPPSVTAPLVAVDGVRPVVPAEKVETPAAAEIATLDALVTRPFESMPSTATCEPLPYVPGVTGLADNCAVGKAPDVMLLALVVSVVADAASPLILLVAISPLI